ncbi:hypothetical protein [Phycicoccus flavus]|uniref:Uncharacterized protein n=1 Tax=Phycicoccus flavus TaxID=2502783 RepID=A0A8T6QZY2_9MICO|nr:hypothetical protein [Phycicoccus flavus]NHA67528.1 hypothetical protein [Phycicoccus flavus]
MDADAAGGSSTPVTREVVVDRAVRRRCLRAASPVGVLGAVVLVPVVGLLLGALLALALPGVSFLVGLVAGLVVAPLVVGALVLSAVLDARRSLPLGTTFRARVGIDALAFGPVGQELPYAYAEMRAVKAQRGMLTFSTPGAAQLRVIPAELLGDGDASFVEGRATGRIVPLDRLDPQARESLLTAHGWTPSEHPPGPVGDPPAAPAVLDVTLADRVANDAAALLARRRLPWLLAAPGLVLAIGLLVGGGWLRWLTSATFLVTVAARLLVPRLTRRAVRRELLPPGRAPHLVHLALDDAGLLLEKDGTPTRVPWGQVRRALRREHALVLLGRDVRHRLVVPAAAVDPDVLVALRERSLLR